MLAIGAGLRPAPILMCGLFRCTLVPPARLAWCGGGLNRRLWRLPLPGFWFRDEIGNLDLGGWWRSHQFGSGRFTARTVLAVAATTSSAPVSPLTAFTTVRAVRPFRALGTLRTLGTLWPFNLFAWLARIACGILVGL